MRKSRPKELPVPMEIVVVARDDDDLSAKAETSEADVAARRRPTRESIMSK